MNFNARIEAVCLHLDRQGVPCTPVFLKPVTKKGLANAEAELGVSLPDDLRDFYRAVGDGFSLFWEADANDSNKPFGSLQIPRIRELVKLHHESKGRLYSSAQAEEYGFPHTKDPSLAKRTAARMWHWLPLIEEGNGDQLCLDLADRNGPVIFDRHDWLDGGSGENGHILASDLNSFLMDWASVCFQFPKHLYWPYCFRVGGGVNWDSEEFREPFRLDVL